MLITLTITRNTKYIFSQVPLRIVKRYKLQQHWRKVKMTDAPLPKSREDPVIMKLDTPEFQSIFTPELTTLSDLFTKYNHEIRVAGGAVRDILMGIRPTDLDFATTASPKEMKDMFIQENIRMINANGEKHGTITPRINDKENFEITSLRVDVVTDGRHAEVLFIKDWKIDANRRDLTINSMYLGLDGSVYDYFYGYDDLKKRRIAFVGDAATRIQEDYLRILRYFRFYGRIAENPENHDEDTIKAIKENVDGLERISGERIWTELSKILTGKFYRELWLKMMECGLNKYVGLPENPNVENFDKICKLAFAENISFRPVTLLTSLLENQDEVMVMHSRLKLSAFDRDLAIFIVEHRDDVSYENPSRPYYLMILNSKGKSKDMREYVLELLRYTGQFDLLKKFENWQIPCFPVNGTIIKSHVPNPKMIGKVMLVLKEIWVDSDFKSTREELMKHVPRIVSDIEDSRIENK